jgi:hypothetical protein
MKKNYLVSIFCLLLLTSCGDGKKNWFSNIFSRNTDYTNTILTPHEYKDWVKKETDHLHRKKEIEDLIFELRYKPVDNIIINENGEKELTDSLYKVKKSELDGMYYFDLKISLKEGSGELLKYKLSSADEYLKRVNYFAFEMQSDINLKAGETIVPCDLFHFERAYDVAPYSIFLLGFNKKSIDESKTKEITIEYHDNVFKKGIIKFTYTQNDLHNLPKLKTI